jgi:hypothetical protein
MNESIINTTLLCQCKQARATSDHCHPILASAHCACTATALASICAEQPTALQLDPHATTLNYSAHTAAHKDGTGSGTAEALHSRTFGPAAASFHSGTITMVGWPIVILGF